MALNCCGVCEKPFTEVDFPQDKDNLVFTVCRNFFLHIYHSKNCLDGWVNKSEKGCPTCKTVIYSNQLGKSIEQISFVFQRALTEDSEIVLKTVKEAGAVHEDCPICFESFPATTITFNTDTQRLQHATCPQKSSHNLTVQTLAKVVSEIVKKYPALHNQFTPKPPTSKERFSVDHPTLYRLAKIGAVALSAFILLTAIRKTYSLFTQK